MVDITVLEYTLADGSSEPAIVVKHPVTAAYLVAIFQLIQFAIEKNMKLTAMEEIITLYQKILTEPVGPVDADTTSVLGSSL